MQSSFEEFYGRGYRNVVAATLAFCGDAEVACEATDEAFVRAFADWHRVEQMGSPLGWVCRVAQNVARRMQRRRALEARLLRKDVRREDPTPDPDLWAAVRQLPERQRMAVVLRYAADLAEADIAVAMGITRGAVASSLAAARQRLAEVVDHPVRGEVTL